MSDITGFVKRPELGRSGKPIRINANFFEVSRLPDQNIFHYDITILPDVPPVINRRVFQQFENMNHEGALGGIRPVYDGRKNIFAPKPLPFGEAATFSVTLPEDDGSTSSKSPRQFQLMIKIAGQVVMEELHQFMKAKQGLTENCLTSIMVIDVLIRHRPSMLYTTVGRSFYTPNNSRPLANGAEVWQGFYQSARPSENRMLINVDVSATAFYEAGPLIDIVAKILNRRSVDELRRGISERDRAKVEKTIKGLRIRVVHRGEVKRKYKISKLTPEAAEKTFFGNEGEQKQDVASYFQRTYNKRLDFASLPCVIVAKETFLPMEVCEIIPGQRHNKKLNERQTADMIKFTCQQPQERANRIMNGIAMLDYDENQYLRQFGLSVKREMVTINARVLATPKLSYHPRSQEATFVPQGGAWNLRGKKVAAGATLGSWSVVAFGNERDFPLQQIEAFIREMVSTFQDTGMNVLNRTPPIMHANPQGDTDQALKTAWLRAGNAAKAQPQLVVCILPNTGVPLYAEIKRISDTVIGIATQCIQGKHIAQPKKQYCANVCLKVNLKLGGMNSFLSSEQIPFISAKPTILFGADVTHPAPGDTNRPSIAAVCASMDSKASRYAASIRVQAGRTEIISDLANMVKELLKTFYQNSGQKPDRILFYRDGVSEGQFKEVLSSEIAAVKAACQSLEPGYNPTITFVVVQKRHHARFFPMKQQESDRTGNCLPGTVVETGITHPFEFDFYLQSHAGLQGTSRPAHYHVLYDENNFTADSLQELTYRLCYLYGRATRAVSIVPPAYYADIIATRARFHSNEFWSDDQSSEGAGAAASFGVVKPELQKVMYFM